MNYVEEEKDIDALYARLARRVWIALLAGGLGIGGVVGSGVLQPVIRPDPFTGQQGAKLAERITALERADLMEKVDCEAYRKGIQQQIHELEYQIRRDMPPKGARQRIKSLEWHLRKLDPKFVPPTDEWN